MAESGTFRLPERIPPLPLWLARVVQVVFVVSVLSALVGIPLHYYPEERAFQQAKLAVFSTGVDAVALAEDGVRIEPLGNQAIEAGVRSGDVVLSVDDHVLRGDRIAMGNQFAGPPGSIAHLEVRRAGGQVETVAIPRSPDYIRQAYAGSGIEYQAASWFAFWAGIAGRVFLWIVAAALLLRHPREPVVVFLAMGWSIPGVPFGVLGAPYWSDVVANAVQFACIPMGLSLFPDSRFASRWNWAIAGFVPIFVATWFLRHYAPDLPIVYYPGLLVMFALLGIAVVTRYRRTPPGTQRQQLKFFTMGLVILSACMIALAITGIYRPAVEGGTLGWRTVVSAILVAVGFTALGIGILVSLLRYRLYDADRTISRSFSIGALTLALVAVFAGSEKIIEVLGEEWFGEDLGALAGGLGAAVAALLIVPLHKRLDRWAEKRFQTRLTRLRDEYPPLVADLRETMPPESLAADALNRVLPVMRVDHGAVMLEREPLALHHMSHEELDVWRAHRDPPQAPGLYTEPDDRVLPTRLSLEAPGHGRIGWLLLGPRPDGSTVGKDEREALEAIADPLARALQVASDRATYREEQRGIVDSVVRRIADLEKRFEMKAAEPAAGN